jgi:hypothetical protein
MTKPFRRPSTAWVIFGLRALAAIGSSAIFGLVVTSDAAGIDLPAAILAGLVFGVFFVGGTGYRIIRAVWMRALVAAPASWSGATAASAIACTLGALGLMAIGHDPARLLLGYALAINFAYLAVKVSCALAGCCHAEIRLGEWIWALRPVEIGATLFILAATGALWFADPGVGALAGLSGHMLLRLFSRRMRGRWSSGWPPLSQPGAELAPLQVLTLIALLLTIWPA